MFFRRKNTAVAEVSNPVTQAATPVDQPNQTAPGKKILVADDDPVVLQALALKLKARGYQVVTAMDGSQIISSSRREKPDLMLLDVNFPPDVSHGGGVPWSGFLIPQWLRRLDSTSSIPFIMISASDRPDYRKQASAAGATAFLPKPINSTELLACIDTALTAKAGCPASVAEGVGA